MTASTQGAVAAEAGTPPRGAPLAFYCVSNAEYFLGAVGMINSLRLHGHTEPIHLLDAGLTGEQRRLLAPHVTLVDPPDQAPPWLLKTVAPLRHPAETMVLIDADMIVTRPLDELIEEAASGRVVAFADRQDRFFPEWGELGLGPARRRRYVSSGLLALGGELGREVLRLVDERHDHVDFERTFWRRNVRDYPFLYADQDVVNAVLACRVAPDRVVTVPERLAATPPYRGLRLADESTLRCAYRDGARPWVVHQYVRKPWLERTFHSIYSRLLTRLLVGDDVAVRVPERAIPLRLRRGPGARAERARINATDLLRWHLGDRLPAPIATRVEDLRKGGRGWRR